MALFVSLAQVFRCHRTVATGGVRSHCRYTDATRPPATAAVPLPSFVVAVFVVVVAAIVGTVVVVVVANVPVNAVVVVIVGVTLLSTPSLSPQPSDSSSLVRCLLTAVI